MNAFTCFLTGDGGIAGAPLAAVLASNKARSECSRHPDSALQPLRTSGGRAVVLNMATEGASSPVKCSLVILTSSV